MESLDLKSLFGGTYAGARVLVTGHTGFKGSWLALWLKSLGAHVGGLALDPDTEPSHWNILGLEIDYDSRTDLRNDESVRSAVNEFRPEIVFHLAAQALVRRGYRDPAGTFASNTMGLVNLFEAVRVCPSVHTVINATTDKVYEPHTKPNGYREEDRLGGHDPYSASKACAELVSECYRRSYFEHDDDCGHALRVATARAGNVVGGGDWAEDRLIPDLMRAVARGQNLRVRNPQATRPWQHVLEPLSGYLRLGQMLLAGHKVDQAWNFGPPASATATVGDVVARLHQAWPELRIEQDLGPHPPEAAHLALDCTKAARELSWHPVWDTDTTLRRTADWYRWFLYNGRVCSNDDLAAYVDDAARAGLAWA